MNMKEQTALKPKIVNIEESTNDIASDALSTHMLERSLPEWRPILAQECQVYVLGENYIGKRFDQINFKYCGEDDARQIVTNNLYALLRYKYFKRPSEQADERISEIVKSFTTNLMTTLLKVSLQDDTDCTKVSFLPKNCIAFRNGVFDFEKNDWMMKYQVVKMPLIGNKMYLYSPDYLIMWYLNYDFEPLPLDVKKTSLDEVVAFFKEICKRKETANLCFELMYNISHNAYDQYDKDKFHHLCQILGYLLLQDFSQSFVMLIGSGGNGKNSLFDGCFTSFAVPTPASNSLEDIERDRFITGALENKAQNIFLETSAEVHTDSKVLKNLTGSMYQTIESKGVSKYSGIINCKYIFSGNDQDKIKFSDTTQGFRRRINLLEIFYAWDPQKRFMKHGDYYDTTFSEDLHELKTDISNAIAFVYFAMYGIKEATNDFSKTFKFEYNDWKLKYSDADMQIKDELGNVNRKILVQWLKGKSASDKEAQAALYDVNGARLFESASMTSIGYTSYSEMVNMLDNGEQAAAYFAENDIFISMRTLQEIAGDARSAISFTNGLKKLYNLGASSMKNLFNNRSYVRCTFDNDRFKIIER